MLELDPEFFAAYLEFSSHPWKHGVLEPKVKELIYTAFDASATHMYIPGSTQHIVNALGYGATPGRGHGGVRAGRIDRHPHARGGDADPAEELERASRRVA